LGLVALVADLGAAESDLVPALVFGYWQVRLAKVDQHARKG
jgi:hypothetical protein